MAAIRRVDPPARAGPLTKLIARLAVTAPMRFLSRLVGWKLDPILLRLTGGRLATTGTIPTGLLQTTGARSGAVRRNAVIYFHDGDDIAIVASHAGADRHPGWFHNLVAHPDVRFNGLPLRAHVVEDDADQARLWSMADRVFPSFATYRRQAAAVGRTIPLVRLRPR